MNDLPPLLKSEVPIQGLYKPNASTNIKFAFINLEHFPTPFPKIENTYRRKQSLIKPQPRNMLAYF